jgi:hypothetical protein
LGVDALSIVDGETLQSVIVEDFEGERLRWLPVAPGLSVSIQPGYSFSGDSFLLLDYWLSGYDPSNFVKLTPALEEEAISTDEPVETTEALVAEAYRFELPSDARRIGIWISFPLRGEYRMGEDRWLRLGSIEDLKSQVVLQSPFGTDVNLPLEYVETDDPPPGVFSTREWHYLEGTLPPLPEGEAYSLSALQFSLSVGAMAPIVVIDNLVAVVEERELLLDSFEGGGEIVWNLEDEGDIGDDFVDSNGRSGEALALLFEEMGDISELGWWRLQPVVNAEEQPVEQSTPVAEPEDEMEEELALLPALVSEGFLEITQVSIGERVGVWIESRPFQVEVVGVVRHFPTMLDTKDAGFIITVRSSLMDTINQTEQQSVNPNEYFITTQPGTSIQVQTEIQNLLAGDVEVFTAESLRKTIKSDPLALGLRSVTTLGYLLTSVLSLVGFGTYFYVSVRERRKMYAVLRAYGMSARQLYGSLLLEQLILILSGLGLGTGLGLLLNALTLPGLPLSLGGQPPVPPFLAEIEWSEVWKIYLTLTSAFLISLGLATLSLSRARLHRVMRVDEE